MQCPLLFLLTCSFVAALSLHLSFFVNQQFLISSGSRYEARPRTHPNRMPDSVELLFTASDDDEMIHVWLPLGKPVSTRDYPVLPLHPTSARIVNVLGSSTKTTVRRKRQQVICVIKTVANESKLPMQAYFMSVFQEEEGVVRLYEANPPLSLGGREVESYECF